jgi:leucyl/phenylalanyl-tRNA---protein transferase
MPVFLSSTSDDFPALHTADEEGLIAIGADFTLQRLLQAYSKGIFPWFEDEQGFIYWFCLQPRCILLPEHLHISRSMQKIIAKNLFQFKCNNDFKAVITHCSNTKRAPDNDTWISPRFIKTYSALYDAGYAFCGETYLNNKLVGGIYGVRIGNVFFGESMFSLVSNASKFALIHTTQALAQQGVALIDCQQASAHMLSMGATCVSLSTFEDLLQEHI